MSHRGFSASPRFVRARNSSLDLELDSELGATNQRFTPTFASFAATFDFRDVRSSRRRGRV